MPPIEADAVPYVIDRDIPIVVVVQSDLHYLLIEFAKP